MYIKTATISFKKNKGSFDLFLGKFFMFINVMWPMIIDIEIDYFDPGD